MVMENFLTRILFSLKGSLYDGFFCFQFNIALCFTYLMHELELADFFSPSNGNKRNPGSVGYRSAYRLTYALLLKA